MADQLGFRVSVHGLDTWQKYCVQSQARIPLYVIAANKQVADMVSNETRRRMDRQFKLPRSERTGELAMSVFTMAQPGLGISQHGHLVLIGGVGQDIPYAGWWEYGYEKDVHPPPFRLFAPRGRTLYPAIRKLYPAIRTIYEGVANRLGNASFRNEI